MRFGSQNFDSYAEFRSRHLDMELSFDSRDVTRPEAGDARKPSATDSDDVTGPAITFYANTLRWIDNIGKCLTHVSRPVRRGHLFKNTKPKRLGLMRHIRQATLPLPPHLSTIPHVFLGLNFRAGMYVSRLTSATFDSTTGCQGNKFSVLKLEQIRCNCCVALMPL